MNPHRHQVFVPCPLHAATGLYCPACGGLRMMHDLMHGHVALAAHDNALAVVAVAAGLLAWLNWSVREWRAEQPPGRPGWLSPAIIVIMIVWTVLRNLPWAPFAALRPA